MLQEARNQAKGIGQGQDKNYNKEVTILHQAFCDHCSTIEGESELSRNKHRIIYTNHTSYPVPSHLSYVLENRLVIAQVQKVLLCTHIFQMVR